MNKRTYIIFSSFVADYLVECGEKLINVRPDLKNPEKQIFVFLNQENTHSNVLKAKELLKNNKEQ